MFQSSDEELVKKALKGNKKAWLSLLSRHEKAIFNYALRMCGNPDDAKDLMQEVFVSVFRSLQNFTGNGMNGQASFKTWMFKIAHFRCMDFFRRKQPNVSLDEVTESDQNHNNIDAIENSPEMSFEQNQSHQHVVSLMRTLPVNQRLVIELKYFSQFTFEEIGQQLGISSNTVKSRLYMALGKLKHAMTENIEVSDV